MMKVIFRVEDYEEEQEYPDATTEAEIDEDFKEWLNGRSEWWISK